ncbi:MAG: PEP-CTERM sorting domain-containing protein [Planctomycetota bacterium]
MTICRIKQTGCKLLAVVAFAGITHSGVADDYIDLGGPATGFLAVSDWKNDTTQNGIEGKDINGNLRSGHNGLPDYANYVIPSGSNSGRYSAIIASPASTSNDYAAFLDAFYPNQTIAVNNVITTQPDAATMSAGRIDYDNGLVASSGSSQIGVNDLAFNFNTFAWDGNINGDGGDATDPDADNPWVVTGGTRMISPFSPVYTPYNDGTGAGNAALFYEISLSNITGTGLTFFDGELTSMDIAADVSIDAQSGNTPGLTTTFTGTFSASGLDYSFNVADSQFAILVGQVNLFMNRAGTASVISDVLLGDLNGDGTFDSSDIPAFVQALTDEAGYATLYPSLDPDVLGDFDSSGTLNNLDIFGFVQALSTPSSELSPELIEQLSALAVPEPGSGLVLLIGGALLSRRRRA